MVLTGTRYAATAMVATVDHLATGAAVTVLREGGNAVDAAIAANAVLSVTSPHMCGVGGDLFALVHRDGAAPLALNASGRAGSGADAERLRREGHRLMPFRGDIRSVTIPGCVDGWLALHSRLGSLELARLLEPARRYAQDGFAASPTLAAAAGDVAGLPGSEIFPTDLRPGGLIRRRELAATMAAIIRDGRAGFYEGQFGEGLVALAEGEYLPEDLAAEQADWVEPISAGVWGNEVWTIPPNSQGYLTLASALIAEGRALPEDPGDPEWAHLLIECAKQAGHDRDAVLHEEADAGTLLDADRLRRRGGRIDPRSASPLPAPAGRGDTTYLCVVDGDRMGVSLIQSNAAGFGSHLAVPGTGVFLHNRGIGFSLDDGHPAEYGPGRRPPHTLSPALVTRDGALHAVAGTMGGDAQPHVLLQVLVRLLVHGQAPGEAVGAGRWVLGSADARPFGTWSAPESIVVDIEGHCPPAWSDGLVARNHQVRHLAPYEGLFGHAQAITVAGDHLEGAADPRPGAGAAVGI